MMENNSSMKWISLRQLYKKKKKKEIGLGQLYKKFPKNQSGQLYKKKKKFNLLVYPYFKICNNKKGTMKHKFL